MSTYSAAGCCNCVKKRNDCENCARTKAYVAWQNTKLGPHEQQRPPCCYIHHGKNLTDGMCCDTNTCPVCVKHHSFFFPDGKNQRPYPDCCCKHNGKSWNYKK
ncbi:hypothetical protein BOX15_Mlig005498g2 [Macrostomum lignano]|uniref:DUF2769 domain-containing protein n=2 Tax=Macrostomum lignano TaxID=282301 RepID=A0A1I8G096_9PLAT|nr:hypothetical protein BOX15_Mlig005498g2 [Macrostomum lignano]